MLKYSLPLILGWDVSGVVEATGAGVRALKAGDEVYSRPDIARDGAYAEYIAQGPNQAGTREENRAAGCVVWFSRDQRPADP